MYDRSPRSKSFAERCAYQGREPEKTSTIGLIALEHNLPYESSTHAVICARHGLPQTTTQADLQKIFGKPVGEISVNL